MILGVEDESDGVAYLSDGFGGSEGETASAYLNLEIGTADQSGDRDESDRFREHWNEGF